MATRKPPIPFKFNMRTATMRTEYSGTIADGIQQAMWGLDGRPKTRAALLEALAITHRDLLKIEAERQAETESAIAAAMGEAN